MRQDIVERFTAELGDAVVASLVKPGDDVWIRVRTDAWRQAGQVAREKLGFDYFCFLSGLDWMPSPFGKSEDDPTQPPPVRSTDIVSGYTGGDTRFQVFARVVSSRQHIGVTLKVDVPDANASIDSWVPNYAGANWHERETWEMFGITFTGHPDLRHMYLPGDFQGCLLYTSPSPRD